MADFNLQQVLTKSHFGYSVSGMVKTSEKADLKGAQSDNNWSNDMENFENDFSLSAAMNLGNLHAGIMVQEKISSNTTYHQSIGTPYLDKSTLWDIGFLNGYLKYTYDKKENWTLNSQVYYRNSTVRPNTIFEVIKATDSTAGKQVGYYRPNELLGMEHQVNLKAHENLFLIAGFVGEVESLSKGFSITESEAQDAAPPKPTKPIMLTNYLVSYYLQGNLKLSERLSLVGGWRHDFSSYYGQVFTPRAGLIFKQEQLTAKMLFDKAFRAPKPWDYTSGLGNSNLDPEKMQSIELDVSYLSNKNFSLSTAIYYNTILDKLAKEFVSDNYRWTNKEVLNTFGFELSSCIQLNDCVLDANYTFTQSTDKQKVFIPEIAAHSANLNLTCPIRKDFKLILRTNYLGQRLNPTIIHSTGKKDIDDALIVHGTLTYLGFKNLELQIKASNLFNTTYYHPSNLFDGRYRQPQPTLLFKTVYHF